MLVLSAMLAPDSSGEATTSRACCDELLAKMPAPQAKIPARHATSHEPNSASIVMPINIDISEIATLDAAPALIVPLASIGYEYVPEHEQPNAFDEGMPFRRYFRKDVNGERAFHMHMVEEASDFGVAHLMFRDFLRISPEDAREYERVKRRVAVEYNATVTTASNINLGYTDKKSDCIAAIMAKARAHFAG